MLRVATGVLTTMFALAGGGAGLDPAESPLLAAFEAFLGDAGEVEVRLHGQAPRTMLREEAVALLARLAPPPDADGPLPATRCSLGPGLGAWCGPDVSGGSLNAPPFCDSLSAWLATPSEADPFLVAEPGGVPGPCGGAPGGLERIVLSPLAVAPDAIGYEGCYAVTWTVHSNGYCPNPFSAYDTFLAHWSFRGNGGTASFGAPGGTFHFAWGVGVACYDMPPLADPGLGGC